MLDFSQKKATVKGDLVFHTLMVRRPDSPNKYNHLNYINIKSFKSSLYTHLYTQLILVCYHHKSMS